MAAKRGKRKKYPKLPNGYGSIKYLGAGRRNPYAVHPPTTEFSLEGIPQTPKALCYVDDWIKGFAVLTAYKAGSYYPGMEKEIDIGDAAGTDDITQRILADYNRIKCAESKEEPKLTFAEVYDKFFYYKYDRPGAKKYSDSYRATTRAAFRNCTALHEKTFESIRFHDLQNIIDTCTGKHSTLELIVSLFRQMYKYAISHEIVDKDCSVGVTINIEDDDEHGVPFTDKELKILWKNRDNEIVEMLLIMCYSGFRINAYKSLEINLKEKYFKGGLKTQAGKERTVPIHSGIYDMVSRRSKKYTNLIGSSDTVFRNDMYAVLNQIGIERHTPHDCRHTFSRLCEKYGVRENDRKRMLGHAFKNDITNGTYGHRSVEELREEIEKIQICY